MAREYETGVETADVLRMFPTWVWKSRLEPEVHQELNRGIVRELDRIRRDLPELAPGQAWQSDQDLHGLETFQELVSRVDGAVGSVLEFLKIGFDATEITALWANVAMPGAGHRMHSHPNNFLSGVYYVRTQAEADTINFHDPRPQTAILRPPVTDLTAENTDQVVVKVEDGTLLLSCSRHGCRIPSTRTAAASQG